MNKEKIKTAYDRVKIVRGNGRPTSLDYINGIFTEFTELHGDRHFGDDRAVVCGLARLKDMPVSIAAIEKGHTAKERAARRSGSPMPEGYRKALRIFRQAEKFGRPVICFVDTSGAYCGVDAEERGQGQAVAENLFTLMGLKVPVISVIIGEGGSGGALALGVADRIWMLENAVYSVISPEGCAAILYKDSRRAADAAQALKITADDSLKYGLIDDILSEEKIGSPDFYGDIRSRLSCELSELMKLSGEELVRRRFEKFRAFGKYQ